MPNPEVAEGTLLTLQPCGEFPDAGTGVLRNRMGELVGMICPHAIPGASGGLSACQGMPGSGQGGFRCKYAATQSPHFIDGRKLTSEDVVIAGFPPEQLSLESRLMYFLLTECDRVLHRGFVSRGIPQVVITNDHLMHGVPGNLFGLDTNVTVTPSQEFRNQLRFDEALRDVALSEGIPGEDGTISFQKGAAETFQNTIINNHHLITVPDRPGEILLFANHGGIALECGTAERADDPLYVRLDPASVRTLEECAMIDMFPLASMDSATPVELPQCDKPLDDPMQIFTNSDLIHYVLRNFRMEFDEPDRVFFIERGKLLDTQPILFEDIKDYLPSPGLGAIKNGLKEKGLDFKDAKLPALSPQHKLAFIKLARREQVIREREQAEEARKGRAITTILQNYMLACRGADGFVLSSIGDLSVEITREMLQSGNSIAPSPDAEGVTLDAEQIALLRRHAECLSLLESQLGDHTELMYRLLDLYYVTLRPAPGGTNFEDQVFEFRLSRSGPVLFTSKDCWIGENSSRNPNVPIRLNANEMTELQNCSYIQMPTPKNQNDVGIETITEEGEDRYRRLSEFLQKGSPYEAHFRNNGALVFHLVDQSYLGQGFPEKIENGTKVLLSHFSDGNGIKFSGHHWAAMEKWAARDEGVLQRSTTSVIPTDTMLRLLSDPTITRLSYTGKDLQYEIYGGPDQYTGQSGKVTDIHGFGGQDAMLIELAKLRGIEPESSAK